MRLLIHDNLPSFNVSLFLLNNLQDNVRLQCYNASFENYFQMKIFLRTFIVNKVPSENIVI